MPFMFLSAFSDEQAVAQATALGAVAYLVKPLDIKQIVPAVEAAFAHIEAAPQPEPGPVLERATAPLPAAAKAPDTTTAMAVGVLMHRYSLDRVEAARRLARLAASELRSEREQAELLLAAVEQLAAPARH
jgi:response regulator NasT